ncbi:MAG: DUF4177 domain-containing protein [Thalassobaculaceae bacterium]|nr:DUF4177 domain-containing protein [Thalassobaculaceae bacterium]
MIDRVAYEYRCVAGPTTIAIKKKEDQTQAVAAFQDIINREAHEGWEYVGIDEFQTAEAPGCLQGSAPKITIFKMLVFRRPRD